MRRRTRNDRLERSGIIVGCQATGTEHERALDGGLTIMVSLRRVIGQQKLIDLGGALENVDAAKFQIAVGRLEIVPDLDILDEPWQIRQRADLADAGLFRVPGLTEAIGHFRDFPFIRTEHEQLFAPWQRNRVADTSPNALPQLAPRFHLFRPRLVTPSLS